MYRLEHVLNTIISDNQTGFIRNRHTLSLIFTDLLTMYFPESAQSPEFISSLDAEKAFDRAEWPYLFAALKKLVSAPLASIQTNYSRSGYFPLTRGTRQGCTLNPLLFAIKPLSIALKSATLFQGLKRGDIEHCVSLYPDYILLYVSDPIKGWFGNCSGFKLNLQ